jgi:hypothetical protein
LIVGHSRITIRSCLKIKAMDTYRP